MTLGAPIGGKAPLGAPALPPPVAKPAVQAPVGTPQPSKPAPVVVPGAVDSKERVSGSGQAPAAQAPIPAPDPKALAKLDAGRRKEISDSWKLAESQGDRVTLSVLSHLSALPAKDVAAGLSALKTC